MIEKQRDGPSLQDYVETRFNLLTVAIEKLDAALRERIGTEAELREALEQSVKAQFAHMAQINIIIQDAAKRAVDKAEGQQNAVNVASNEWRSTLNDFKSTTASKSELGQLRDDFAAYRLEQSRLNSRQAGVSEATKETKDDSRAMWAMLIAVASAAVSIVIAFMKH